MLNLAEFIVVPSTSRKHCSFQPHLQRIKSSQSKQSGNVTRSLPNRFGAAAAALSFLLQESMCVYKHDSGQSVLFSEL